MKTKKEETKNEETKNELFEGKVISKEKIEQIEKKSKDFFKQILHWFKSFDRASNIHKILGILSLIIGLILLRGWILGLIFLVLGILLLTGYFEKDN